MLTRSPRAHHLAPVVLATLLGGPGLGCGGARPASAGSAAAPQPRPRGLCDVVPQQAVAVVRLDVAALRAESGAAEAAREAVAGWLRAERPSGPGGRLGPVAEALLGADGAEVQRLWLVVDGSAQEAVGRLAQLESLAPSARAERLARLGETFDAAFVLVAEGALPRAEALGGWVVSPSLTVWATEQARTALEAIEPGHGRCPWQAGRLASHWQRAASEAPQAAVRGVLDFSLEGLRDRVPQLPERLVLVLSLRPTAEGVHLVLDAAVGEQLAAQAAMLLHMLVFARADELERQMGVEGFFERLQFEPRGAWLHLALQERWDNLRRLGDWLARTAEAARPAAASSGEAPSQAEAAPAEHP